MKPNKTVLELVGKWIEKADKDLLSAERELTFDIPITETVCFHCQQAVEKYLKAFLIYHQTYFPKTHKIIELIDLCSKKDTSIKTLLKDADKLTDYAVEIRYPDVGPEPDIKEAKEAVKLAKQTKKHIVNKINS